MSQVESMPLALRFALIAVVLMAGIFDLRIRRIPNWLNLSGIVLGLGLNGLHPQGFGVGLAILGLLFSMAVYVPLYMVRGMGAGDVKLMAAVGAMAGPHNWFCIFILTALLGGACSLVLICMRGRTHQTILNVGFILTELLHGRMPSKADPQLDIRNTNALRLPHGTVIAAGSLAFLFLSAHV